MKFQSIAMIGTRSHLCINENGTKRPATLIAILSLGFLCCAAYAGPGLKQSDAYQFAAGKHIGN